MATQAWKGQGTIVQYSDLESGSVNADYNLLEEVRVSNDEDTADELDATNHDSEGAYKEFVSGSKDFRINLGGNWLPHRTSHQNLAELYRTGARRQWRIRWPQMTPHVQMVVTATVTRHSHAYDTNTIGSHTVTLRPAGAPVYSTWS